MQHLYMFSFQKTKSRYLFPAQHFTRWILEIKNKACYFSLLRLQEVSWPCNQAYCRGTGPRWRAGEEPGQF